MGYVDELASWVKKKESSKRRQDKSLVAFLAIRDDVVAAIDAGYSLKTIWEHLTETKKISYRYETFLKHVKTRVKGKTLTSGTKPGGTTESPKNETPKSEPPKPSKAATAPAATPPSKTSEGFKFNATPNKGDLL